MNSPLLKQVLNEYSLKRQKAIEDAENRKKELLEINPKLQNIENELSKISIEAAKAVITADEDKKKKILAELKKNSNALIKEKNNILKELSKSTDFLKPHFECNMCKDTGFVEKNGKSVMCSCLKQEIYNIAYNKWENFIYIYKIKLQ